MKKITTLLAVALLALQGQAKVYNGQLTVSVNGVSTEQSQPITIEESNNAYSLSINDFKLLSGADTMYIGNIVVQNLANNGTATVKEVSASQNITITSGSDATKTWVGPYLGEVPINMTALFSDSVLRATININMTSLGQVIKVSFLSDGVQMPNGGFEYWHTSGSGTEPNSWHSFTSATGTSYLISLAGVHVKQSSEVRPGTEGTSSAVVYSSSIFGIIANGTMTTGRLNCGSATATDVSNHSFLDMSKTDKDGNGDPFYTSLTGMPDSINVWVKFKQQKANSSYPYATISAAITDGTYYQDPADQTYSNVVATAQDAMIETNNNAWQNISIPFEYKGIDADPKAILITASTNATPGKGGGVDSLYVDDIKFVYNCEPMALLFRENKIDDFNPAVTSYSITDQGEVTADDFDCGVVGQICDYDVKEVSSNGVNKSYVATITSYAGDLSSKKVYTVTVTSTTGVEEINDNAREISEIYNIQGVKVNNMEKGNIYVVRYNDGTATKVVK